MPFDTPAGPAVLVENLCKIREIAYRLGVHVNAIYHWIQKRDTTNFPQPLSPTGREYGDFYDYAEVYDWFQMWVKQHPKLYPAAMDLIREEPT
jgi:predicted DNA-binding transcriptional regulator AlpA